MGFGDGNDVFYIGLKGAPEQSAAIRAVDHAVLGADDSRFDRLRVGIIGAVVGRAAMFGGNGKTAPRVRVLHGRGEEPGAVREAV